MESKKKIDINKETSEKNNDRPTDKKGKNKCS